MMFVNLILSPLLGFVAVGLFGRFLGYKGTIFITLSSILFSTFASFAFLLYSIKEASLQYFKLNSWITSGFFLNSWEFVEDSVSCTMMCTVLIVSSLVHLYSLDYMGEDPHLSRFLIYLNLFTFFMLLLVSGNNLLLLFVGWEGVGICSYLLINFWFTRINANKSAIKAVFMNRIGDYALTLGIALCYMLFQSIDFDIIYLLIPYMSDTYVIFFGHSINSIEFLAFFLFMGSMGKSAQIGLHTWLPDAMEGPTPVSALIHAATMVTAGVFLIIRSSFIFEYAPITLNLMAFIGSLTAFFAASIGLVQHDLKKVIAYSTCSQLGYMIFICGFSNYVMSFFHLINHAFFKALLFLAAGSIIHALGDEQDIRKMGSSFYFLPITYITLLIGSLSLAGFPFLSGFYSKDAIIEYTFSYFHSFSTFSFILGTLSAFLTSFYSFRLLFYVFFSCFNGYKSCVTQIKESSWIILTPLIVLSFFSIFSGYFLKDLFLGGGSEYFFDSIYIKPNKAIYPLDYEYTSSFIKIIPLIFSFLGIILSLQFNKNKDVVAYFTRIKMCTPMTGIFFFLNQKWHFDQLYNYIASHFLHFSYKWIFKTLDKGFCEWFGPYGMSFVVLFGGIVVSKPQTGFVIHYMRFIPIVVFCYFFFYSLHVFFF